MSLIFFKIIISIFKSISEVLTKTCDTLFGYGQIPVVKLVINLNPVYSAFIMLCLVLGIIFLRISKYSTISLDIFFILNFLILVMYHEFKDPQVTL